MTSASKMPAAFVEGAWVNVNHGDQVDAGFYDPAKVTWRGDTELALRFPGEDFDRVFVHEHDDVFVQVHDDGPHGREYRSEATLTIQKDGHVVVVRPGSYNDEVRFTADGHAFALSLPTKKP